jgi:hypothetical protein
MSDATLIGPWVRRFLLEHVIADRNFARNTQVSYRDALVLLLPYVSNLRRKGVVSDDNYLGRLTTTILAGRAAPGGPGCEATVTRSIRGRGRTGCPARE